MPISTLDLARARDSVGAILDELELDAVIFRVEPRDGIWELTIECACDVDGGWETVTLEIPKTVLTDSLDDTRARQQLMDHCRQQLANCKSRQS